jgi:colicin import membrane protein
VKPEPKAAPKPEPAVKEPPAPTKADIALKEKQKKEEAAKAEAEEKAKKETAAKAVAEKQKAAAKAAADAKAAQQKAAQEQAAAQAAAQAQQTALNKLRGEYIDRIRKKIRSGILIPSDLQGNPEAEFEVRVLSGGQIMNVQLTHSSGNNAYDQAVERAIYKADPLPLPPDPALAADFRELNLKFRPKE